MNNYTNFVEIGKGSFGTVYKASKHNQTEPFAIKKVRCNAPENVELALQEFWTLSCLQKHLNIIRFEECYLQHGGKMSSMKHGDHSSPSYLCLVEMSIKGECTMTKGRYHLWFVMEYCDGGDMNDYLLSRVPTAKLNASFMSQLADGIAFLHRSSVVHRDLKPENILVRTKSLDGDGCSIPTLKIADFGLSKVCASKNQGQVNVDSCWLSSACGSDFFMAPEVFEGHYTAKADVFALGIMFWAIMDRITFIDASTKKVLLGTYIRRDKEVLPVGEAMLDDSKLNLDELISSTSIKKNVIFAKGSERSKTMKASTCVSANKSKLRELIAGMLNPNADVRPNSQELLEKLQSVLIQGSKSKKKQVAKKSPVRCSPKAIRPQGNLINDASSSGLIACVDARSPVTIEQFRRPKRGHLHRIVNKTEQNAAASESAAAIPRAEISGQHDQRLMSNDDTTRQSSSPDNRRVLRCKKERTNVPSMQSASDSASEHSKSPQGRANALSATTKSRKQIVPPRRSPAVSSARETTAEVSEGKATRAAKSDRVLRSAITKRRKTLRAWTRRSSGTSTPKTSKPLSVKKKAHQPTVTNVSDETCEESDKSSSSEEVPECNSVPNPFSVAVKKRWKTNHKTGDASQLSSNNPIANPKPVVERRRRRIVISVSPKPVTAKTKPAISAVSKTKLETPTSLSDPVHDEITKSPPTRNRPSLKQQIIQSPKPQLAGASRPKSPQETRRGAVQPSKLRIKLDKSVELTLHTDSSDSRGDSQPSENSGIFSNSAKRKLSEPREESEPKRPKFNIPLYPFSTGVESQHQLPSAHSPLSICSGVTSNQSTPKYSQAYRSSLNSLSVGNSPRMSSRPTVSSSLPSSPHIAGSSGLLVAAYRDRYEMLHHQQVYHAALKSVPQRRSLDSQNGPNLLRSGAVLSPELFVRACARKSISHDLSPASSCPFLHQSPLTVPPVD